MTTWTEKEIGEYMASALLDSKRHLLIGDTIQGFEPFSQWSQAMDTAYYAKTSELEAKRRNYLKSHRRNLRASSKGLGAIDFNRGAK